MIKEPGLINFDLFGAKGIDSQGILGFLQEKELKVKKKKKKMKIFFYFF
jgi:hypothetical protein